MSTGPAVTIARASGAAALLSRVFKTGKLAAYVGVPAAGREARKQQLLTMAGKAGKKKAKKLKKAAESDINNAELLFIQEHGSPINHIPARRVLGPAVEADGNRQAIAHEITESVKASLAGDHEQADKRMLRAALAGQNSSRRWFVDGRNGWAPNAPRTIKAKGSDKPLIDTGALRASIVGVVRREE